jgi:cobalamin biosynthesis protein CobT
MFKIFMLTLQNVVCVQMNIRLSITGFCFDEYSFKPVTMSACSSAGSDSETDEAAVQDEDGQDDEKDFDDTDGMDDEEKENTDEANEDLTSADQFSTITALPPKAVLFEENHMEVSASPAFHILDTVSQEHRLHFLGLDYCMKLQNIASHLSQEISLLRITNRKHRVASKFVHGVLVLG